MVHVAHFIALVHDDQAETYAGQRVNDRVRLRLRASQLAVDVVQLNNFSMQLGGALPHLLFQRGVHPADCAFSQSQLPCAEADHHGQKQNHQHGFFANGEADGGNILYVRPRDHLPETAGGGRHVAAADRADCRPDPKAVPVQQAAFVLLLDLQPGLRGKIGQRLSFGKKQPVSRSGGDRQPPSFAAEHRGMIFDAGDAVGKTAQHFICHHAGEQQNAMSAALAISQRSGSLKRQLGIQLRFGKKYLPGLQLGGGKKRGSVRPAAQTFQRRSLRPAVRPRLHPDPLHARVVYPAEFGVELSLLIHLFVEEKQGEAAGDLAQILLGRRGGQVQQRSLSGQMKQVRADGAQTGGEQGCALANLQGFLIFQVIELIFQLKAAVIPRADQQQEQCRHGPLDKQRILNPSDGLCIYLFHRPAFCLFVR